MEIILIHTARGLHPPELVKAGIDAGKDLEKNAEKAAPGCKLIASYVSCSQMRIFCIWDAPKIESLMPLLGNMVALGWDTEVIPVMKTRDGLAMMEKTLAQMAKK
jgi:hypothetical protein